MDAGGRTTVQKIYENARKNPAEALAEAALLRTGGGANRRSAWRRLLGHVRINQM